ncbi:MAG: lytic murein transglycosylase B [Gammaproteobacteria bacterium]|nr:lytic murein transglycosylase B [Gammaproteobacteria bacterium]
MLPVLPRRLLRHLLPVLLLVGASLGEAAFVDRPEVGEFMDEMVTRHGFERDDLKTLFAAAERQQGIIDAISRPAERVLTWGEYREIFLDENRIAQGLEFWETHGADLARAEAEFGVPPEVVVAIIGVETRYGRNKGRWRVLDALSTLAFDYPPRAPFFRRELEAFLLLAREEERSPTELYGSYAGAMGYGQFIPSSYRAYAIDFTGNATRDIWDDPVDAIGSVANYLAVHGWRDGEEVTRQVALGTGDVSALVNSSLRPDTTVGALRGLGVSGLDGLTDAAPATLVELQARDGTLHFIGLTNFYAITRYNHSRLYAMAVHELSQAVLERRLTQLADR